VCGVADALAGHCTTRGAMAIAQQVRVQAIAQQESLITWYGFTQVPQRWHLGSGSELYVYASASPCRGYNRERGKGEGGKRTERDTRKHRERQTQTKRQEQSKQRDKSKRWPDQLEVLHVKRQRLNGGKRSSPPNVRSLNQISRRSGGMSRYDDANYICVALCTHYGHVV